jgi:Fur family transcriptional regulator, ferric uptake regulator
MLESRVVSDSPLNMADLLHQAGLRRTPMRFHVLQILNKNKQAMSAAQILEELPEAIDKVTLYRTLNTLTDKKLLHRITGDDQSWRYGFGAAHGRARHEHAHFICDQCGAVECLADASIGETMAKKVKVKPGYSVEYSEMLVHGTCPECH